MVGTDFKSYMAQFMSHLEQMKTTPGDFLLPFFLAGLHFFIRYEVTRENPATLTEAIAKARQVSLDAPPPWYSPQPESVPVPNVSPGYQMDLDFARLASARPVPQLQYPSSFSNPSSMQAVPWPPA